MATFLAALRFAVNVEDHLQHLQTERFRRNGDTSTRLFPPLVPIAGLNRMPPESALDAFRKRHVLEVAGSEDVPVHASGAAPQVPPAAYTLAITGYRAMVADFVHRFQPSGTQETQVNQEAVTDGGPPEFHPAQNAPPVLRLGWTGAVSPAAPPGIPRTRALWLCIFAIELGPNERWWNGCSWDLLYLRRFSARSRPEASETRR
ncbi:MAG: hypothetical protein PF508_14425 [Spirochaeta sp.]|jgi:hypothetical protein|nr:hypothetical protein [Spirochaeta sp.]